MNLQIYHGEIKTLARLSFGAGRLASPDGSAQLDNPLCGDRVRVDVALSGGRVVSVTQETKGCMLCTAAASIVGKKSTGVSAGEAERVLTAVEAVLSGRGAEALEGWPEIQAFTPVAAHRSRINCVLLPFKALLVAIQAVRLSQGEAGYGMSQ